MAFSSITRSNIEAANVTPLALMVCKSIGVNNHGFLGSPTWSLCGTVLANNSTIEQIFTPILLCKTACGFSALINSDMVATARDISKTSPSRTTTTAGPATSGSQIRPTKVAFAPSVGNVFSTVNAGNIPDPLNINFAQQASPIWHFPWMNSPPPK